MSEYLIRLIPNTKQPPRGPQQISNDPAVHQEWLRDSDLGLMLKESKRVVLDWDGYDHKGGKDLARMFFKKFRELCTGPILETPSGGIHMHYSGETQTRKILDAEGREIGDVKGSGYVKWIGTFRGKAYRLLQDGPLQPFSKIEHLFPIPEKKEENRQAIDEHDPVRRLVRARAWMMKREGKEDGNGRGLQTIKTCRALFRKFLLTEAQVWPLMLDYNDRCKLGYTVEDLRHKIADAMKGNDS